MSKGIEPISPKDPYAILGVRKRIDKREIVEPGRILEKKLID